VDRPLPNPSPQPSPAQPPAIGEPGAASADDVDRWMQEGLAAFQAQEYTVAVDRWESLLQHDRSNYRIMVYLSLAYNRMEAPELARGALMRAVKIEPRYAKAWNNLGNSFRDTGELFRAIDAYEKAVDLSPASADYRHNLAITYLDTLQYEPAIEQLRQYRALVPDDDTILSLLASAYYQSGMPAKALSCVLKYLQRHPNTSQLARMRAQVRFLRTLADSGKPAPRAVAPPREPLDDEKHDGAKLDAEDFVISISEPEANSAPSPPSVWLDKLATARRVLNLKRVPGATGPAEDPPPAAPSPVEAAPTESAPAAPPPPTPDPPPSNPPSDDEIITPELADSPSDDELISPDLAVPTEPPSDDELISI